MENNQNNGQYHPGNSYSQDYPSNQNNPNPGSSGYHSSNNTSYNSSFNTYNNPGQQSNHPNYPNQPYDPTYATMTFKDWLIPQLLLLIPIANLILPFIWAFGNNVNKNKKAFFQAHLVIMLIRFVLSILILVFYAAVIIAIVGAAADGNYL